MKRIFALCLACMLLCAAPALAAKTQNELLEGAQNTFVSLASGDYAAIIAQLGDVTASMLDESALAAAWESVSAQMGAMTGVLGAQADETAQAAALLLGFEGGSLTFTVAYDEAGKITTLRMTPEAADAPQAIARALPDGASAQAVTLFPSEAHALRGEILRPANADEHTPYVVFAHGSGPSDMDESLYAQKPLRDLAYDLAALGVGSLRFDKITYTHPQRPCPTITEEYTEPVAEALRLLKAETGASRVYLAGHSLGGMLTPHLVETCGFDGGVSLAGTPKALWEISYAQNLALIAAYPEAQREAIAATLEPEYEKALRLLEMTDEEAGSASVFGASAVYQRSIAQLDEAQIAKDCGKPFLFLWGEADFQVDADAFAQWQARLGDDPRFTYKTYPGLNHLFMQAGAEDSIANAAAAYAAPQLVDPQVAQDIAAWIHAR